MHHLEDIWKYCIGPRETAVRRTEVLAIMQQEQGIWRCFSGPVHVVVHEVSMLARLQQREDDWKCFSGFVQMAVQDEWTCSAAAREGHLAALQLARTSAYAWDESTCRSAAERGHLEVLQWLVHMDARGMQKYVGCRKS